MNRVEVFWSVIRNRNAALLLLASLASSFGDWFCFVGLSVWFYKMGGAAYAATFMAFRIAIPILVTPLAGIGIRKQSKRSIMIAMDMVRALLYMILTVVWVQHKVVGWLLLTIFGISAICTSLFRPARLSLTTSVVARPVRPGFNALDGAMTTAALAFAPAAGGLMLHSFGLSSLLLANGATFVFSACCVFCLQAVKETSPEPAHRSGWSTWIEGPRFVHQNLAVNRALWLHLGSHLVVGATWVAITALAKQVFHEDADVGYLTSAIGLGSVVGMFWGGMLQKGDNLSKVCGALFCLSGAFILFACTSYLTIALLSGVFMGIAANMPEAPIWTIYQNETPERLQSSVFGLIDGLTTFAMLCGSILTGFCVPRYGMAVMSLVVGTSVLVVCFWDLVRGYLSSRVIANTVEAEKV